MDLLPASQSITLLYNLRLHDLQRRISHLVGGYLTRSERCFIVHGIPEGSMCREISLIWEIPAKTPGFWDGERDVPGISW